MKKTSKKKRSSPVKFRPVGPITPAQFIRQNVLRMSITELSHRLNRALGVVARYETFPEVHRDAIMELARERGAYIVAEWFNRVPLDDSVPHEFSI